MTRYLLCRPQGGLNDMLCQIEKCCRYAELAGRTVVVDTNYRHSFTFHDRLDRYFVSRQARLILNASDAPKALDTQDILPAFLAGRINDYVATWNSEAMCYYDLVNRQPLSFDFSRDHPQSLLVHHDAGGGQLSLYALLRLGLAEDLADELRRRLDTIGAPYVGVHVRNTDYRTNYQAFLTDFKPGPEETLFVATDSLKVLEDFRSAFGTERVRSFASLPPDANPIHTEKLPSEEAYARNRDAILDLLMLALARNQYLFKLEANPIGSQYSGFSLLAHNLWSSKIVLKHLISRPDIGFGLG